MGTKIRALSIGLAALVGLASASRGHAQVINLYGDLGVNTWLGAPFSPVNSTVTTPFTWSAAAGSITGDVIVANDPTGTIFDLTITNLTYTCTTANAAGKGDVIIQVQHTYATSGSGTYTGSQSLAGSWTSGPASIVQLDSIQDYTGANFNLPSLIATTSPFSLGPVGGSVLSSAPTYQILATLRLETDGTGAINLPSSAHVHVEVTPAPAGAGVFALGGLVAARRRRA